MCNKNESTIPNRTVWLIASVSILIDLKTKNTPNNEQATDIKIAINCIVNPALIYYHLYFPVISIFYFSYKFYNFWQLCLF